MIELLLCLMLMFSGLTALSAFAIAKALKELREEKSAPAELPKEAQAEEGESLPLDRGFENLMRYQVQLGRGRETGGGIQ